MKTVNYTGLIFLTCLVLASCDEDNISRTPEEEYIIGRAYDEDYVYPESFFYEVIDTGSVYYVNTVSIKPVAEREHVWVELNTNDRNEARLWSDKTNEYSSVDRQISAEKETGRYFEFKRVNVVNSRDIVYTRAHRTNYFKPLLNRFSVSDSIIGEFNGELTLLNVEELVEYLWSCSSMNAGFTKVLKSETREYTDSFESYIQSLLIVYGDFGVHDELTVFDNYIRLNKSDRKLIIRTTKAKTISGKLR
jgi:hypothetical protein